MLWERHAKMESMTFAAIVFTILKDMDNEIVMQNHYVRYNYFDDVLFFSQQIISISTKLWEYNYTKIVHKHKSSNFVKVLNYQCNIFLRD